MRHKTQNWVHVLAIGLVASFDVSSLGAASPAFSGIGMALGQPGISPAGYRRYYDDAYGDGPYYSAPHYYAPPVRYPPPAAAYFDAPVYEWLPPPRPVNCGEYKYWNGEYCADARYNPPYVGPRW
jgi:hypothetical protein